MRPLINQEITGYQNQDTTRLYTTNGVHIKKGFRILSLTLYPVQYDKENQFLYYYPEITVHIQTEAERKKVVEADKMFIDVGAKDKEEAEKKVRELNARFADWYYVISDDVYRKIHLSRDQIIKKKEAKEGEGDDHAGHDHGLQHRKHHEIADPIGYPQK